MLVVNKNHMKQKPNNVQNSLHLSVARYNVILSDFWFRFFHVILLEYFHWLLHIHHSSSR